ncbi:M55 family metallopeptidase [Candidatus Sumerlaeota bacterium]|nr:M55 family metallopeptidase [Candidatus Sumerlaeales bacterium]NLD61634.1 M55 family metallopeptidase [Candidatus Sumerlaeota bacterium]
MKVVIWGDMEGISCVTRWGHVNRGHYLYETEGRALYTGDINAAVRGAKRAGADEIVVVDGHGAGDDSSFNSLIKERLEPGANYVFGHRWGCFVKPFQEGYDCLILIGTHARAGVADGVLCHTMSSVSWHNAWIGDRVTGEIGISAAIAGAFNVPCIMVSGDAAVARDARDFLGENVVTAQVKVGCNRESAMCMPPADSTKMIEDKVASLLQNKASWVKPYVPPTDKDGLLRFTVEFLQPDRVESFIGKEGVTVDGRKVTSVGKNFWEAWDRYFHH